MSEPPFSIANKEWAKRVFSKRLMEVATEKHGHAPENTQIALRCGVDKSMITRYLKGAVPKAATILRIAEAYGVSADYLVGNDDVPDGGFGLSDLEAHLPLETFQNVVRIMYRAQDDLEHKPSAQDFARASAEVLEMVAKEPEMPEYAIFGAARMLLQDGPGALAKPRPE